MYQMGKQVTQHKTRRGHNDKSSFTQMRNSKIKKPHMHNFLIAKIMWKISSHKKVFEILKFKQSNTIKIHLNLILISHNFQ